MWGQRIQNLNNEYPIPDIREIIQDHYGFLWFATINGIVRYDGYHYEHYLPGEEPTKLNGRYVESLLEDSNGRIWVGLKKGVGLEVFNRNTEVFTNVCLTNPKTDTCYTAVDVYTIKEDLDHTLWIGTSDGLIHFDPDKLLTIHHFQYDASNPSSFNDDHALEIGVAENNTVWVGSRNGINKYDRKTNSFINSKVNPNYLKGQILDIIFSKDGELIISGRHTPERLYQYIVETDSFKSFLKFDQTVNNYLKFDLDQDGNGIYGTRGFSAGHISIDLQTTTTLSKEQSIHHGYSGQWIQDVLYDKYGNGWLTGQGAFYQPSTGKVIQHIPGNGYPVRSIHTIGQDVLYSLDIPYVWSFKTKKSRPWWTFPKLKTIRKFITNRASYPQLFEIQQWDKEHLVMTTPRNILLYNTINNTVSDYPQNSGGIFLDFIQGKNHDLYITEGNNYLRLFNFADSKIAVANTPPLEKILYAKNTGVDSLGNHWYGMCEEGVFRYNEITKNLMHVKLEIDSAESKTAANFLYEIYTHASGQLYFGTENGLWSYDNETNKLSRWGTANGIQSNIIASIEADDKGNLWLGTGTGLTRFNITSQEVRNYSTKDGFLNNRYWWDSSHKGLDGTLYFGGTQGIDFFHPDDIAINAIAPDLHLGMFKVNAQPYSQQLAFENLKSVTLSHKQNYIEIELLGIHLTTPEGIRYAYQINDRPWIELGTNRTLTLSNLNFGTYIIRAKASNADDIWSGEKQILKIDIRPPWWRTYLFYAVAFLLISGLIIWLYQYRIQQAKTHERQQTAMNKQVAEIELKALQTQMNPHFLFNSLNSVKSLISKGETQLAINYLTQFSRLIRLVLNNSRKKFVRLNDELSALELYLQLESARFGASFNYEIVIGQDVSPDFLEVPPMLLQPFVENSIWHGLLHKESGNRNLRIFIDREDELVKMIVEDNGIGRAAAAKLQTRSSSKRDSLGLKITEDRLSLLYSIYGREANIEIVDIVNRNLKAQGTRVTITLPIPA